MVSGTLSQNPSMLSNASVLRFQAGPNSSRDYTLSDRELRLEPDGDEAVTVQVAGGAPPVWLDTVIAETEALAALPADWDSYGAPRLDRAILIAALRLLGRTMRHLTPAPSMVPLSTGGVQMEWHELGFDIEVELVSPAQVVTFVRDRRGEANWEEVAREGDVGLRRLLGELTERLQSSVHPAA